MIVVKLMGGLGNQMFQYAAGRSLAHIHKTDLKLDLSFLNADTKGAYTKREYALQIFTLDTNFANSEEVNRFKKLCENRYRRFLFRKLPFLFNRAYITESGAGFHQEFFGYPVHTYLDGFWQSENYFSGIEDIVHNDFNLKQPLQGLNKDLADKITHVNSVSMHIRRGDYVMNESVLNFHGVCPPAYYKEGLEIIKQKEKNIELFVFSDDAAWCKQNLLFDLPCTYIDHNQGDKSFEDMRLMSFCKHNIIANSSFSWWGAWLNKNAGKTVIAPKKWFNDPKVQSPDIYPLNWIKI
jgi:hypothetical protein